MNLARLNHVLIPATHAERERLRRRLPARLAQPLVWIFYALSTEGRVLALAALFVGAAGLEVGVMQVYLLWSVLFGLLCGALGASALLRLGRVRLEVRAPARVALGESASFELVLRSEAAREHHNVRLGGPFLPWDGRWESEPAPVARLGAGGSARSVARARFLARGEHHLDAFWAAELGPLGLSLGPAVHSEGCRLLVLPRIAPVASLVLPARHRLQPGGLAGASRTGESAELFGLRPYRPGDPVRDLHARTWARTGIPHVREYQQEYFVRAAVILDLCRAGTSERVLEAAISLAAGVVARLSRSETLVDLLVAGPSLQALTIGRSLGSLEQALDLLAGLRAGPSLEQAALLAALDPYLERLSAAVLITPSRERLVLGRRIAERDVPCRALRVAGPEPFWRRRREGPGPHGDASEIPVWSIEGEEPLRL
ncbi:MAG: DUF58 domain-containing protein [Deltaproteobacteria bacterium]|nr:DUF58 domain-containing protein [Deltaproteobacteria bacterium]